MVDYNNAANPCERALVEALERNSLPPHHKQRIQDVLEWYQGNATEPISLLDCLVVVRLTTDNFHIRLDSGVAYRYLTFDDSRGRVTVVDPTNMRSVPIEESHVTDFFESAHVSFVVSEQLEKKAFDVVTVITHPDEGARVIPGRYTDTVTLQNEDGDEVIYEAQTVFELPEQLSPDEIYEWLQSTDATDVKEIIKFNSERGWGAKPHTKTTLFE